MEDKAPARATDAADGADEDARANLLRGWLVVMGSFLMHLVTQGVYMTHGLFLLPYADHFGVGRGGAVWVATLCTLGMFMFAPIAGRLGDWYGVRATALAGALLFPAVLLLASVSGSLEATVLLHGAGLGTVTSLLFFPGVTVVSQWFDKHRGAATGFAASGSGVGMVLVAPFLEWLIDGRGWRVALRATAAAGGALLLLSAAMLRRKEATARQGGLEWGMLRDRNFRLLALASALLAFGYNVPLVHLAAFASDHGLESSKALLLSVMGASNALGRVLIGALSDSAGHLRTLQGCFVAITACLLVWPLCVDLGPLLLLSSVYGLAIGTFYVMMAVVCADLFGTARLSGYLGVMLFGNCVGALVGPPMVGWLHDETATYSTGIWIMGGVGVLASGCALLVDPDKGAKHA